LGKLRQRRIVFCLLLVVLVFAHSVVVLRF
jgi:hypothetical protein